MWPVGAVEILTCWQLSSLEEKLGHESLMGHSTGALNSVEHKPVRGHSTHNIQ